MTVTVGHDSQKTRKTLTAGGQTVSYYSIPAAEAAGLGDFARLPAALKVVLENMLRFEDGKTVTVDDIRAFSDWGKLGGQNPREIAYRPARVLMQDFTGVPAVVDLAAMRDGIKGLGGDAQKINPLNPVDLVIDHSVMIDEFGNPRAFQMNVDREYERNMERYVFLKWGQKAFNNFRVVPPGTGICHQVNLEYLAQTVWTDTDQNGATVAYPDTLVGTDSHTTMVNGLAVLGWGVGGIEAEAAMLGQPVSMLIPEVVGFKLTGRDGRRHHRHRPGAEGRADAAQARRGQQVRRILRRGPGSPAAGRPRHHRQHGPGIWRHLRLLPDRRRDPALLRNTGRDETRSRWSRPMPRPTACGAGRIMPDLHLDPAPRHGQIVPAISGPKRPQDYLPLTDAASRFYEVVAPRRMDASRRSARKAPLKCAGRGRRITSCPRAVVIAAITSCTNTSNPYVMIGAGLVARKARALGLNRKPWVKTSLAPGSQVVGEYLNAAGLQEDLDAIGFNLVGYGCTTCIGNSGPLQPEISKAINENDLVAAAVLSGNRNFEGRISPDVRANYLASPPLVVAYALAGDMNIDLTTEPLGTGPTASRSILKDIWPTNKEIADMVHAVGDARGLPDEICRRLQGRRQVAGVQITDSETYDWPPTSTYIQNPPYFRSMAGEPGVIKNITGARVLALLGDMITTDHISPAGSFKPPRRPASI
jgi:aconitate hydratase